MKISVVADFDTVTGFRLAGVREAYVLRLQRRPLRG